MSASSAKQNLRAARHLRAIDAACPLARMTTHINWWREGGATAIAPTVTGMNGNARTGFAMIGG